MAIYKEISLFDVRKVIERLDVVGYADEWKEWAQKWYGPKAYMVRLSISSEYNDEGYSTNIDAATVLDKNGKSLDPDPQLHMDDVKEEIERLRYNRQDKAPDRKAIYATFKEAFPMLDDTAWNKMTDADIVKKEKAVEQKLMEELEGSIREETWDMDYPDNGDVGQEYSSIHEFIVADDNFKAPKFFVLDE